MSGCLWCNNIGCQIILGNEQKHFFMQTLNETGECLGKPKWLLLVVSKGTESGWDSEGWKEEEGIRGVYGVLTWELETPAQLRGRVLCGWHVVLGWLKWFLFGSKYFFAMLRSSARDNCSSWGNIQLVLVLVTQLGRVEHNGVWEL